MNTILSNTVYKGMNTISNKVTTCKKKKKRTNRKSLFHLRSMDIWNLIYLEWLSSFTHLQAILKLIQDQDCGLLNGLKTKN